ncbi:MAG: iron-containing redox enzyme family protein [Lentisphaeraceae bacterium]|nr:iron-containing redox enzyme family protein [Lentisphaeraceae bacterium]
MNLVETIKEEFIETCESLPWSDKSFYTNYLAQTFYYVQHSTKLLALGAALMDYKDKAFEKRFIEHIAEEGSHELLALRDLQNMGHKIEDISELPETRMAWESQYYKIQNKDPLALMGYILFLEYVAVSICPSIVKKVKDSFDGPVAFVKLHGEEDIDHVQKAIDVIESLSEERKKIIYENYEQSALSFKYMLLACNRGI